MNAARLPVRGNARTSSRDAAWLAGRGIFAICICLAVVAPFVVSGYTVFQFTRILCIGIAVLSINLLLGYSGQVSIGHSAIFGLGAYTTAILVHRASVPYGLAILAGGALAFAAGFLLGLPALRIRGLYLGLLTLGIAVLFPTIVAHFRGLTGGPFGISIRTPSAPFGIDLGAGKWLYFLSLATLLVFVGGFHGIVRGRIGRALGALRKSEAMAAALGVGLARTKTLIFAISAGMAGIGGGLYQLLIGTATPATYTLTLSLAFLVASVVGGLRSSWGAIAGAAFVVYVPDKTASLGSTAPQLVYAIALAAVIYFLPGGVAALPPRLLGMWRSKRPRHALQLQQRGGE